MSSVSVNVGRHRMGGQTETSRKIKESLIYLKVLPTDPTKYRHILFLSSYFCIQIQPVTVQLYVYWVFCVTIFKLVCFIQFELMNKIGLAL